MSDESFIQDGEPAHGHDSALPVRLTSGFRAYAKPGKAGYGHGGHPTSDRAAREKIASDLGYYLGLPVAPVLLSCQTSHLRAHLPDLVALSFVAIDGRPPKEFNPGLTEPEIGYLRSVWSAMHPFRLWIADDDHRWDQNFHAGRAQTNSPVCVFFDFEHSLTKWWTPPAAPQREPSLPGPPCQPLDLAAMDETLTRIESFPSDRLRDIVGRLPDGILAPCRPELLVEGLLDRAKKLRTKLDPQLRLHV